MTSDLVIQMLGHVVTFAAAFFAAGATMSSRKIDATASPYQALADRVVKLESQVGELRAEIDELRAERGSLRDLVAQMWKFIDEHISMDIQRPFIRPAWLDRATADNDE